MNITVIEAPTAEPVTLAELKAFARVDSADEDSLITGLGISAREFVETVTGRQLMTTTLETVFSGFPFDALIIPRAPLQSVVSLTYLDRSGNEEALVESVDFHVDKDSTPARIAPARYWPAIADRSNAVRIRFIAGYPDANAVPQTIKTVICALTAHWFEFREPVTTGATTEVPFHVKRLMGSARLWGHL